MQVVGDADPVRFGASCPWKVPWADDRGMLGQAFGDRPAISGEPLGTATQSTGTRIPRW
jgi:hypothetical protein